MVKYREFIQIQFPGHPRSPLGDIMSQGRGILIRGIDMAMEDDGATLVRLATAEDIPALNELIDALSVNCKLRTTQRARGSALGSVFGVDPVLIEDRTYFVAAAQRLSAPAARRPATTVSSLRVAMRPESAHCLFIRRGPGRDWTRRFRRHAKRGRKAPALKGCGCRRISIAFLQMTSAMWRCSGWH